MAVGDTWRRRPETKREWLTVKKEKEPLCIGRVLSEPNSQTDSDIRLRTIMLFYHTKTSLKYETIPLLYTIHEQNIYHQPTANRS